jgi:hypothetical protein
MSSRYTYATTIYGVAEDVPFAELEVEVSYTVAWGSPESGRFGPPEHYDPGSGSVVEDIRVERVEGLERPWRLHPGGDDALVALILGALDDDGERAAMIQEAAEEDAGAYEDAMERRAEEAREERL